MRTPLGRAAAAAAAPAATPAAAAAAVGSGAGLAPAAAGGHAEGDAPLRREEVQKKTWYQLEPAFPRGGACTVSVTRPRQRSSHPPPPPPPLPPPAQPEPCARFGGRFCSAVCCRLFLVASPTYGNLKWLCGARPAKAELLSAHASVGRALNISAVACRCLDEANCRLFEWDVPTSKPVDPSGEKKSPPP